MEALVYYGQALRLEPDHRNSILGAERALRDRGQKGRLHQLLIRWHVTCRPNQVRRLVYTGDIYIRSWDLYKPNQATLHPVTTRETMKTPCSPLPVVTPLVTEERNEESNPGAICVGSNLAEDNNKLHPG